MATFLTISGSPAPGSATDHVLSQHVTPRLVTSGHRTEHLVLRELPAAALLLGHLHHPRLTHAAELLGAAEGIVVGTPVYKAAYSGLLKTFLDVMPRTGLAGRRVLQLVVGHSPADGRLTHEALDTVLASMGASTPAERCFVPSRTARALQNPPHEATSREVTAHEVTAHEAIGRELDAAVDRLCTPAANRPEKRAA
ncbi:NAD(P)H-dependent oxidoreductase [Streptomyces sp. NPDC088794]|uniref:NAD(P)H-dependent oxidoreductase n=1 Tax=Streptomyces sp. NPDC088794 TaxID=3365902 RepID=UPI003815854A